MIPQRQQQPNSTGTTVTSNTKNNNNNRNNNSYLHDDEEEKILWSAILRNDTILVEVGEDPFDGAVKETAQAILDKKPTPGWEFCTLKSVLHKQRPQENQQQQPSSSSSSCYANCGVGDDVSLPPLVPSRHIPRLKGIKFHLYEGWENEDDYVIEVTDGGNKRLIMRNKKDHDFTTHQHYHHSHSSLAKKTGGCVGGGSSSTKRGQRTIASPTETMRKQQQERRRQRRRRRAPSLEDKNNTDTFGHQEKEGGTGGTGTDPVVWVFAAVYNEDAWLNYNDIIVDVKNFVQKIEGLTCLPRQQPSSAWRCGKQLSCQRIFAAILLQRMQEVTYYGKWARMQQSLYDTTNLMHDNITAIFDYEDRFQEFEERSHYSEQSLLPTDVANGSKDSVAQQQNNKKKKNRRTSIPNQRQEERLRRKEQKKLEKQLRLRLKQQKQKQKFQQQKQQQQVLHQQNQQQQQPRQQEERPILRRESSSRLIRRKAMMQSARYGAAVGSAVTAAVVVCIATPLIAVF